MDLRLEKSLQAAGLGKGDIEDKMLPMQQVPPLHVIAVPPLHVTEVPPLHVTEVPPLHVTNVPPHHVTEVPPLRVTEVPPLHVTEVPPLHDTDVIQGKGKSPYSLAPVLSQELPEQCCGQRRTALGTLAPYFSSGFTPEAFPETGYSRRTAEVWNRDFPSQNELQRRLTSSICPTILQYPPDFVTMRAPL